MIGRTAEQSRECSFWLDGCVNQPLHGFTPLCGCFSLRTFSIDRQIQSNARIGIRSLRRQEGRQEVHFLGASTAMALVLNTVRFAICDTSADSETAIVSPSRELMCNMT